MLPRHRIGRVERSVHIAGTRRTARNAGGTAQSYRPQWRTATASTTAVPSGSMNCGHDRDSTDQCVFARCGPLADVRLCGPPRYRWSERTWPGPGRACQENCLDDGHATRRPTGERLLEHHLGVRWSWVIENFASLGLEDAHLDDSSSALRLAPHGQEPNIVVTSPGTRHVGITTSPFMTSPHTEQINRYMKRPKPPQPDPKPPAHAPSPDAPRGPCPRPLLIRAPMQRASMPQPTARTEDG